MAEAKGFSKGGPFTAIDKALIDCVEIKVEAWDRFNEVAAKALAIVVSRVIMKLTEHVELAATGAFDLINQLLGRWGLHLLFRGDWTTQ